MAQHDEAMTKLWSMIKDIKVAMMTTWDGEQMHARPMHGHQQEFAGKLYFLTRLDSGKTDEIRHYDKLNLAYADTKDNSYVSVAGRGRITTDRTRIREFWNPVAAAWFPQGLDDPDLALIEVDAEAAQYWDGTSSSMKFLYQIARANPTGREPELGESRKLDIG